MIDGDLISVESAIALMSERKYSYEMGGLKLPVKSATLNDGILKIEGVYFMFHEKASDLVKIRYTSNRLVFVTCNDRAEFYC